MKLTLILCMWATAVFLVDIYAPLGVAGGVLYVLLVVVSLWFRHRKAIVITAVIGTLLTLAGLGRLPHPPSQIDSVNVFLALFVTWTTAILSLMYIRNEEDLRVWASKLEQTLDASTSLIAFVGPDERVEFVNRALAEMFRIPQHSAIHQPLPDVIGSHLYESVRDRLKDAAAGTVQFDCVIPFAESRVLDARVGLTPCIQYGKSSGLILQITLNNPAE